MILNNSLAHILKIIWICVQKYVNVPQTLFICHLEDCGSYGMCAAIANTVTLYVVAKFKILYGPRNT